MERHGTISQLPRQATRVDMRYDSTASQEPKLGWALAEREAAQVPRGA